MCGVKCRDTEARKVRGGPVATACVLPRSVPTLEAAPSSTAALGSQSCDSIGHGCCRRAFPDRIIRSCV